MTPPRKYKKKSLRYAIEETRARIGSGEYMQTAIEPVFRVAYRKGYNQAIKDMEERNAKSS